jgi:hypothetical protein
MAAPKKKPAPQKPLPPMMKAKAPKNKAKTKAKRPPKAPMPPMMANGFRPKGPTNPSPMLGPGLL